MNWCRYIDVGATGTLCSSRTEEPTALDWQVWHKFLQGHWLPATVEYSSVLGVMHPIIPGVGTTTHFSKFCTNILKGHTGFSDEHPAGLAWKLDIVTQGSKSTGPMAFPLWCISYRLVLAGVLFLL